MTTLSTKQFEEYGRAYREYGEGKHSGFLLRGRVPIEKPTEDLHLHRVFWLISMVECGGFWGTVQNYDGAGMSAGPLHSTAVFPRAKAQGDLWKLVRLITLAHPGLAFPILNSFENAKWFIGDDGVLRSKESGRAVPYDVIQEEFSGKGGRVRYHDNGEPTEEGERSFLYASMFRQIFESKLTYDEQRAHTLSWLLRNHEEWEHQAYVLFARSFFTGFKHWSSEFKGRLQVAKMENLGPELDLAMAVYHSHSVNAPSVAREILNDVLAESYSLRGKDRKKIFAKRLIWRLGTKRHARWQDNADPTLNANRYDRTRIAVERGLLWPIDVISELMPMTLPKESP